MYSLVSYHFCRLHLRRCLESPKALTLQIVPGNVASCVTRVAENAAMPSSLLSPPGLQASAGDAATPWPHAAWSGESLRRSKYLKFAVPVLSDMPLLSPTAVLEHRQLLLENSFLGSKSRKRLNIHLSITINILLKKTLKIIYHLLGQTSELKNSQFEFFKLIQCLPRMLQFSQ